MTNIFDLLKSFGILITILADITRLFVIGYLQNKPLLVIYAWKIIEFNFNCVTIWLNKFKMLFFEKKVEFTFLHGFNASKWQTIPTQLRLECTYAHIALIFFVLVYRLLSVASAASVPLRGSTCNGRKRAASEKKPNTLTLTAWWANEEWWSYKNAAPKQRQQQYLCICTYTYIHIFVSTHTCAYVSMCIYLILYARLYIHTYKCMYKYIVMCMYIYHQNAKQTK